MRPWYFAAVLEIVGINGAFDAWIVRRLNTVGQTLALRVILGLLQGVERQLYLRICICRGGIAHQRFDPARRGRFMDQQPLLGFALAGLHGITGGPIDNCIHFSRPLFKSVIMIVMVGAARFELTTPGSQNQCSTKLSYTPTRAQASITHSLHQEQDDNKHYFASSISY